MRQDSLFHESIYDALKAIVDRAGGAKDVGAQLWPAKPVLDARKRLLDCLNPDRDDKLDPDEVLQLLRIGRELGYHGAKHWIDTEVGYQPSEPADPADEQSKLVATIEKTTKELHRAVDALDKLRDRKPLARVA